MRNGGQNRGAQVSRSGHDLTRIDEHVEEGSGLFARLRVYRGRHDHVAKILFVLDPIQVHTEARELIRWNPAFFEQRIERRRHLLCSGGRCFPTEVIQFQDHRSSGSINRRAFKKRLGQEPKLCLDQYSHAPEAESNTQSARCANSAETRTSWVYSEESGRIESQEKDKPVRL